MKTDLERSRGATLTGTACRCNTCLLTFATEEAYERHRVGAFGFTPSRRRCLTVDELTRAGYVLNEAGRITHERKLKRPSRLAGLAKQASATPQPTKRTPPT
jgi:hypothetical protein